MTPDERQQLETFLADLSAVRVNDKDAEADGMIARVVRGNPDAAYVLVQHAILANRAIAAANARIGELERQSAPRKTSFLGGASPLGGTRGPWGNAPGRAAPTDEARQSLDPASGRGGGGGFLRSVAATAAGVVGGQFLFAGLSNLLGGGRGPWDGSAEAAPSVVENVTINDYFINPDGSPVPTQDDTAAPGDPAPDFGGGDFGGGDFGGGGDAGGGGD
ncbi:MAG: DUF2076 family protein [Bauldia sp.]